VYNPAEGFPGVVPELTYANVAAASQWLSTAFGFREFLRQTRPDGVVTHVQMDTGAGVVMLAAAREGFVSPPDDHRCNQVIVFVRDVDRHFSVAAKADARVVHRPTDKPWGLRQYLARDLEGHMWEFSQHVRDVPPEEWGAQLT
jgi:uncharacterized glyoxalase superfamily protein PhnB